MNPNRDTLKNQFMDHIGWENAHYTPLVADASKRSYERVKKDTISAMLMNAPYENGEDVRPFIAVTQMLLNAGLSAPRILAENVDHGFLLLEDFGDALFASLCKTDPSKETLLYETAIDVLVELHKKPVSGLEHYDNPTYQREANLLPEWYLPAATGQSTDPSTFAEFNTIVSEICSTLNNEQSVLVMRDYHAENLIWLPQNIGVKRVGLLDYQDALAGHPAYDLVSLLQDARRDTSVELQNNMIARYLKATGYDSGEFMIAYNILGMQRNIKIVGIFARLSIRDKKSYYTNLISRVWDHLQNNLNHPACHKMKAWFDSHVPEPNAEVLAKIKGPS